MLQENLMQYVNGWFLTRLFMQALDILIRRAVYLCEMIRAPSACTQHNKDFPMNEIQQESSERSNVITKTCLYNFDPLNPTLIQ